MTAYEAASLWAQWVGSISAALAVLVAALFGYLTYANNRRSRDNQQRATLAAAMIGESRPRRGLLPDDRGEDAVDLSIRHGGGETWLLVNDGAGTAGNVRIEGLTTLDQQRLQLRSTDEDDLGAGQAREFVLVSRLSLSGPANIVVRYRVGPEGPERQRVLQVPAP